MRSAAALAAAALALLALAAAGCGGSGSSEDQIRAELEAGVTKLANAKSLEASALFEVDDEEEATGTRQVGCLITSVERGKPLKLQMLSFDLNCEGGSESHEVIAIGNRAWSSTEAGSYSAVAIAPGLPAQTNDEVARFKKVFAAADGIEEVGAGGFIEPDGKAEEGPEYAFTAPASSFHESAGDDEEVEFEAVLDQRGYLRELRVEVGEEGARAIVIQTYGEIDQPLQIGPPDSKDVSGPVVRVEDRSQLRDLLVTPVMQTIR